MAAPLHPVLPVRCVEHSAPRVGESSGPRLTWRWRVDCGAHGLVGERVGIDGLRERRTDALLRIRLADGRLIQAVLRGDQSALTVPVRMGRLDITRDYLGLGFEHIVTGLDHLLFVLGLVLLVRGRRRLLWTITAFTVGHSVTLSLAVLGIVRIPTAPVEVLIAITIFVVAGELTREHPAREGWMRRAPWAMAFAFGLLHGLGFAGALAQVGLPAAEIPLALFAFNVGIELGQLLFVGVVLAARATLGALPVRWPPASARIPAYAIGSLAAFWVIDRVRGIFS
jgi:hydrogenase/urease accessory protein HupE